MYISFEQKYQTVNMYKEKTPKVGVIREIKLGMVKKVCTSIS